MRPGNHGEPAPRAGGLLERLALPGLRRLSSSGAILCYHSLTAAELPAASPVHVPLASLLAALAAVERLGRVVPLSELVRRHREGRSTAGLVAVTFDDAYAALPRLLAGVLERTPLPITVFVVTDASAEAARFWWDRVDDLFPHVAPERWRAFEEACGLPEAYRRGQPAKLGPLRPLRQWMLAEHRGRWPARLEPLLAALEAETGVRTAHRAMSWPELAAFAASPGVEVGVHTRSHPVLPLLADEEVRGEIREGFHALRERIPAALPILSIPFGLFEERTLRLAREEGMLASLTLGDATLPRRAPGEGLPRFCISRHERLWTLRLRLSGLTPRAWSPGGGAPSYPVLPSPTT